MKNEIIVGFHSLSIPLDDGSQEGKFNGRDHQPEIVIRSHDADNYSITFHWSHHQPPAYQVLVKKNELGNKLKALL